VAWLPGGYTMYEYGGWPSAPCGRASLALVPRLTSVLAVLKSCDLVQLHQRFADDAVLFV